MEYTNEYTENYVKLLKHRLYDITLKFEILDWSEKVIEEITYDIKSDNIGKISANYKQGARRTISFSLYDYSGKYKPSEDSPFQTYKKFKVYLGIKDNNDIYWWSQGIFIAKSVSYNNRVLDVEGVDKFGVFTDALDFCKLQETYVIPRGTNVKGIISDILMLESKKMTVYDNIEPIIDLKYINATLPYDIKKEIGSYIGDILIEIATSMNADIYYDMNGHLRLTPNKDGKYMNYQPQYHYEKDDLINFDTSIDISNAKNIFTVYGYDEFEKLHQYTAINDNPLSPIRQSLLGNKPAEPEENDMCTNDETCIDYANYLLKQNAVYTLSSNLDSHVVPNLDVDNVVAVTDDYYGFDYMSFVIKSLNIPLGIGLTSVELTNIQYLPNYTQDLYYTNILYEPTVINLKVNILIDNYLFNIYPVNSVDTNINISWGDGIAEEIKSNSENSHTYELAGNYIINIKPLKTINDMWCKDREEITEFNAVSQSATMVKSLLNLDAFSFYGCSNLAKVIIGDKIVSNISSYSFSHCDNLTNVEIGKDVQYIGQNAFSNCISLTSVKIGTNVRYIGFGAFANCNNLTIINYDGSQSQWESILKEDDWCDDNVQVEFKY